MGAMLSAGRFFTPFDNSQRAAVVVVNEAFARRYLGPGPAVGRSLRLPVNAIGPLGLNLVPAAARRDIEIVGVVGDVRNVPFGQTIEPALYVPTRQFPFSDLFVAVKAESAAAAVSAVRAAVRTIAPDAPLGAFRTWGERLGDRTAEPRLLMAVRIMFGVLAALLAAVGVYGLLAWSVATKAREFAIRLALGAPPAKVGRQVLGQSAVLIAAGLAAGVAIVRIAERALASVLYDVSPGDPTATTAAGALLAVAALAACVPAAVRAMRVAPVEGLRAE